VVTVTVLATLLECIARSAGIGSRRTAIDPLLLVMLPQFKRHVSRGEPKAVLDEMDSFTAPFWGKHQH